MDKCPIKVAVTGAAGQIGYALLFRIASGGLFGPETPIDLRLLELEAALPALKGVMMELEDGAFPLLHSMEASADPEEAFQGADLALLVGSVPRKAGMERGDLLKVNGGVFIAQGQALDRVAKESCKVLVVGNPCNTNAYIAKTVCRRLPSDQFFAMTMLDELRAKAQLARKAGVPVADVGQLAIWGNHSATQFPDFYHARIQGRDVQEVITDQAWLKTAFIEKVQKRGAEIIQARGLSSAASAANAVVETVKALYFPTGKEQFFSVAVSSDGSYGIPQGLMFSFPVRVQDCRWQIVQSIEHGEFAQQKVRQTTQELMDERLAVEQLFPRLRT